MATVSGVKHIERRSVTEEELEAALRRVLSIPGVYDGDEIARILRDPHYGFEFEADGQFQCYGIIAKILRENQHLELALVAERDKTKLAVINYQHA